MEFGAYPALRRSVIHDEFPWWDLPHETWAESWDQVDAKDSLHGAKGGGRMPVRRADGRRAVIGALEEARALVAGTSGTVIRH